VNKNSFVISVLGIVLGFMAGFWVANNFFYERNPGSAAPRAPSAAGNQAEPNASAPNAPTDADQKPLTPEEIKNVIAKADAKPADLTLQKQIGIALYQIASAQQDISLLPDVRRLLERANQGNTTDTDLMVALGNINFDIAQSSDPDSFKKAREYYAKALAVKPDNVNVRTDLGLTYFFDRPSDPTHAIAEYRKSLAIDPKHELTLQNMAFALIATGGYDEAEKTIATLESVNPANTSIANMRAQLAQKRNAGT
jgi:tetratricopeptide (TPR) repeat protein